MEPFKEFMNASVINTLGDIVLRVWPEFKRQDFIDLATASLAKLELKERVIQVRDALDHTLPEDFDAACQILLGSLHPSEDTDRDEVSFGPEGACGFAVWPLTEFVSLRGRQHTDPATALGVLKEMTKRFSAEFAVRPFLAVSQDDALSAFMDWTNDGNRHVRRLASEGCRPLLPWGMRLKAFVDDPQPLLPILEALKDDPEEYVRRSVANNLNDIAKHHPALVVDISKTWMAGASRNRKRLVKHACRTLIKQGDAGALGVFGYAPEPTVRASVTLNTEKVVFGETLGFDLKLDGLSPANSLMIDYAIHFVKANGSRAPKVFKWKDITLNQKPALSASRIHAIKKITTRRYYPGAHMIEVIVNGRSVAEAEFELLMP